MGSIPWTETLGRGLAQEGRKAHTQEILTTQCQITAEEEKRENMAVKGRRTTDKCHGTERTVSG